MTILENYTNKLFNKSIDACNDAELYKALLDIRVTNLVNYQLTMTRKNSTTSLQSS